MEYREGWIALFFFLADKPNGLLDRLWQSFNPSASPPFIVFFISTRERVKPAADDRATGLVLIQRQQVSVQRGKADLN